MKHPDYLTRVFTRAQRYLPHITAELERRDLPLDLALLPIVESAYDPFAYSHGRAAGLWQMIPGTAKRFGVKQNWWYDGRRDLRASTSAAVAHIRAAASPRFVARTRRVRFSWICGDRIRFPLTTSTTSNL